LLDKNAVNNLFTKGKSVKAFPLVMYSIKSASPEVVFSVPKRKINKAVDRNKIKRQMREIYFNDLSFSELNNTIGFVYISKLKPTYYQLKQQMSNLLKTL
jgi:ribonuclease P protein component